MASDEVVREQVKEYYSKVLSSRSDLKSGACCADIKRLPPHIADILPLIHPAVSAKFYGCGIVVPDGLKDAKVLDLGSGSGHDCFVLSKLVGSCGSVTGIDMTKEQLDVAREHIEYHMDLYGYNEPNVSFVQGYIETLTDSGIEANSYDIIISNCVVNLSPDKTAVLREAFKVLKEGGEVYFSDVYADRQLSDDVKSNKVLWGECISGALWWEDLYSIAKEVGFCCPMLVTANHFPLGSEELQKAVGEARFVSATYRLFKITTPRNEDPVEVTYDGSIPYCKDKFVLDYRTVFETNKPVIVGGELAQIIQSSRFHSAFRMQPLKQNIQIDSGVLKSPFTFADEMKTKNCLTNNCCVPKKTESGSV